ncbi:hypothetical protein ACKWTF_009049 [Chironomus riparius]
MLTKTFVVFCILLPIIGTINGFIVDKKLNETPCKRIPPRDKGNDTFSPYILNGQPADIRNYPFKLSLHIFERFECSASVISPIWSLTAGHCVESRISPEYITLIGGTSNRAVGGYLFNVEEYHIHPDYNPLTLDCDAAVMRIRGAFWGVPNIRPVILANEACRTNAGSIVKLAGWGLNEVGYYPNDLFEIHQEIIDNDSCYLNWGGDITDRMLCAAVENEVDSCSGDSGGAVLQFGCLQVGIISFGSNICGYPIPSVFTRVENPIIRGFIRYYARV